jgi:hypothetical protein
MYIKGHDRGGQEHIDLELSGFKDIERFALRKIFSISPQTTHAFLHEARRDQLYINLQTSSLAPVAATIGH